MMVVPKKTIRIACKGAEISALDDLHVLQKDLKDLSEENFEKLKNEIDNTGYAFPIHVWKDVNDKNKKWIVGGTQRKRVLTEMRDKLGYVIPSLPIVVVDADNIKEAKLRILQDISQFGEMTKDGLYQFLQEGNIDVQNVIDRFEMPIEMDKFKVEFYAEPKEEDNSDDEIPIVQKSIVKLGDVWQLGKHRLMCGDSTSAKNMKTLMNGEIANICFTSPPYNGDTHLDYGNGNNKKLYKNDSDNKTSDKYVEFCHQVLKNIFAYTEGFIFWNVNYNAKSRFEYIQCIYPYIDKLWETIIWKKTGMPIPSGLTRNCEFIFCFKNKAQRTHISKDFETEFNLWDISNNNSQHESHKACFPVALPEKGIEISTEPKAIVLDVFGGSGSTLIACEKTQRECFMMELDPHYCDVIISRWEKYTDQKAVLL